MAVSHPVKGHLESSHVNIRRRGRGKGRPSVPMDVEM